MPNLDNIKENQGGISSNINKFEESLAILYHCHQQVYTMAEAIEMILEVEGTQKIISLSTGIFNIWTHLKEWKALGSSILLTLPIYHLCRTLKLIYGQPRREI